MDSFTEKSGYKYIGFVDKHSAKELKKYGAEGLIFIAVTGKPSGKKRATTFYHVYLKLC